MRISPRQWASYLHTTINQNPANKEKVIKQFWKVLKAKNGKKFLPLILKILSDVESKNTVYLHTPHHLDGENKQDLLAYANENISPDIKTVKEIFDPTLIGGVKLIWKDKQLDLTTDYHLEIIKENLCKAI